MILLASQRLPKHNNAACAVPLEDGLASGEEVLCLNNLGSPSRGETRTFFDVWFVSGMRICGDKCYYISYVLL